MTWLGDALGRIADDMPDRDLGARAIEIHQRRRRNLISLTAAAVVVVTVLAATVGVRALLGPPQETAVPVSPPEQTTIRVGVVPSAASAPLYLANAKGYFEQEGLTVEPQVLVSVAHAMPLVSRGDLDLGQTDYYMTFVAAERGIPLKIVGSLYQAQPGTTGLVVRARSAIRSVADLKGKKIGVPYLGSIEAFALQATLERAGLGMSDVKLVETPLPELITGMEKGRFAAALLVEPFVTQGVAERRTRLLADPMTGNFAGLHTAGWMATDDWVRRNPATLAAFRRALAKAHRLIASDPGQVEAILPYYIRTTKPTAVKIKQGAYPATPDMRELRRLADLAREKKWLKSPLDPQDVVVPSG
ncbi:ABC transporter substrate-binding protein [Nonomuraea roseola]|uniref:ABC transporter substrate-binding protein n=1 Tax=Nonomuraea roseola TaxID=46179 RepID=A0ABV5PYL6_9ACTN